MLARTFKTAAELGLQDHEHQVLITVLYMAEDGIIGPDDLHMPLFHCGTRHCLAGWCNTVNREAFPEVTPNHENGSVLMTIRQFAAFAQRLPNELHRLFGMLDSKYHHAGFDTTFKGLRSYLETGMVP